MSGREWILFGLALVALGLLVWKELRLKAVETERDNAKTDAARLRILLDETDKENQRLAARLAARASFEQLQEDEKTQAALDAADLLRRRAAIHERIEKAIHPKKEANK